MLTLLQGQTLPQGQRQTLLLPPPRLKKEEGYGVEEAQEAKHDGGGCLPPISLVPKATPSAGPMMDQSWLPLAEEQSQPPESCKNPPAPLDHQESCSSHLHPYPDLLGEAAKLDV